MTRSKEPAELPVALRGEQLSGEHPSKPRDPDLAGAFHRTGGIEVWGQGTKRVIDACRAWGIDAPTLKVEMGVIAIAFHSGIRPGHEAEQAGTRPSPSTDVLGDSVTDSVGDPVARLFVALERSPLATSQLQAASKRSKANNGLWRSSMGPSPASRPAPHHGPPPQLHLTCHAHASTKGSRRRQASRAAPTTNYPSRTAAALRRSRISAVDGKLQEFDVFGPRTQTKGPPRGGEKP